MAWTVVTFHSTGADCKVGVLGLAWTVRRGTVFGGYPVLQWVIIALRRNGNAAAKHRYGTHPHPKYKKDNNNTGGSASIWCSDVVVVGKFAVRYELLAFTSRIHRPSFF